MKVFAGLCFAGAASAVKPSFELGMKLGDKLSEGITDGSIKKFDAELPKGEETNPMMQHVVEETDAKYSFLNRPVLNLHVAETRDSSDVAERAALNAALTAAETDFVRSMEARARSSFLEGDAQRSGVEVAAVKQAADYYISLLDAPGSAERGLGGLLRLASLPNAWNVLSASSAIFKAARVAKRESEPDSVKQMASSLITFLTNKPVVFQNSDATTGAYGTTNIVVPSPSRIYGHSSFLEGPFEPREIMMDVNKDRQSVINIIPEASFLSRGGSLLAGLDSSIKAQHPSSDINLIHQTLGDALVASAIAEGVDYSSVSCVRDFSASQTSSGKCGVVDLSGLTPAEKSSVAAQCEVSFPCM